MTDNRGSGQQQDDESSAASDATAPEADPAQTIDGSPDPTALTEPLPIETTATEADAATGPALDEPIPLESPSVTAARPRVTCPNCGSDVEQLVFCGVCGQALEDSTGAGSGTAPSTAASRSRYSRFRLPTGRLDIAALRRIADLRIVIAAGGALLVLLALLASEAGLALLIAAAVLPLVTLMTLDRLDVFDREPALMILGVGAAGLVAGVVVALINRVLLDEFWDKNPVKHIGSVGLAGELVGRIKSPPVSIFALAGVVVPALAVALMMAAPIAARRWHTFRNEAMDGITLGAASGGGFALGTAIVTLWPLISGDYLAGSVADWTVATIAIALLRPLILMGIAALVGVAIWRFDLSQQTQDLVLPFAAGLGGAIAYAFFGLIAEQSGASVVLLWNIAVVMALVLAGRVALASAIRFDRRTLASNRVVCPNCRRVTPAGKFCAFCQAPLPATEAS